MRIGIITQPLRANYGGLLQNFALQTVLKRCGHEVITLDWPKKIRYHLKDLPTIYCKSIVKLFLKIDDNIFEKRRQERLFPIIAQNTQPFVDKYITSCECADLSKLNLDGFGAFVVGSDQVWRGLYNPNIYNSFLGFTKGATVKRIAYAASFGVDNWGFSDVQTRKCAELVQDFDAVSVREDSGVGLCKQYLGVDAEHVLDPTMLLNCADYRSLIQSSSVDRHSGQLMTYLLDLNTTKQNVIDCAAQQLGLEVFSTVSKYEDLHAKLSERIQPSVEQWLAGFDDANFVVTDSFHGCVFSIIFNKPFIVIGNERRGLSRFKSLLKMFNLEDRLFCSGNGSAMDIICRSIDWTMVNDRLAEWRNKSNLFLNDALK